MSNTPLALYARVWDMATAGVLHPGPHARGGDTVVSLSEVGPCHRAPRARRRHGCNRSTRSKALQRPARRNGPRMARHEQEALARAPILPDPAVALLPEADTRHAIRRHTALKLP
jgi:hypothetical protein